MNAPPPNWIIRGERIDGRPVVTIDRQPFAWHGAPDVTDWSPTGIEWGHFGAGSKRLAFTILLAVTDRHEAYKYAPWFAQGCLARIGPEREPWALTTDEVRDWLATSPRDEGGDARAAAAGGQAGATVPSVTVTPDRTRSLAARTTGSVVLTRERPGRSTVSACSPPTGCLHRPACRGNRPATVGPGNRRAGPSREQGKRDGTRG